jgi:hypothetical protein
MKIQTVHVTKRHLTGFVETHEVEVDRRTNNMVGPLTPSYSLSGDTREIMTSHIYPCHVYL